MDSAKKGLYGWLAGFFAAGLLQPLENIKMVLIIPPKDVILTRNFLQNFVIAVKYLARDKSFESFYKGLVPNIMKTACSSAVYFTLLRHLEQFNRSANSTDSNTMANSFFSSLIARVASALVANPLAVVETRF